MKFVNYTSLSISLLLLCIISINNASAALGEVTGEINLIRSHDTVIGTDWMQLKGVTSAGNCLQHGGSAIFLFKDNDRGKRHLSIAMAAKLAGKSVVVSYDDIGLTTGGYCYIRFIDLL